MKRFFPVLVLFGLAAGVGYYYFYESQGGQDRLTLYGNVDIREVNLGFRVFGRIETMHFEEGSRVKAGELLAQLDKAPYEDDIQAAKADVAQSQVAFENAVRDFERKKKLLKPQFASQKVFYDAQTLKGQAEAQLMAAKARLTDATTRYNDTDLKAPNDGTILTRVREPGSIVSPAENVYILALDEPVWVRAYVSQENLGRIYPGMPAQIFSDSDPGKPYEAKVGFISPVAEFTPKSVESEQLRANLVYRLRVVADNPDKFLRQGMPVTVKLDLSQKQ